MVTEQHKKREQAHDAESGLRLRKRAFIWVMAAVLIQAVGLALPLILSGCPQGPK